MRTSAVVTSLTWLAFGLVVLVRAQLLVAKNYATTHVVAGEPVEVTYELYNQGEEPVKNIEIMDASFLTPLGKDFSLFKALPEETYPMRVAELKGRSRHLLKLRVEPLMTGSFADAPAVIEYERHHTGSDEGRQGKNEGEGEGEGKKSMSATAAGGMEKATVYSTGRGVMQVISKFEYITHVKGHRSEWSLFLIGALLLTCLPYVRYRQLKGQLVKMNFAFTISGPTNGSGHTKGDKKK